MSTHVNEKLQKLEDKRLNLLDELRELRARLPLPVSSETLSAIEDMPGFLMRCDAETLRLPDVIDQVEARLDVVEAEIEQILGMRRAA